MPKFDDGWYQSAEKKPSRFFNERPDSVIDLIVLHNISLPSGEFATGFVDDLFLGCLDCAAHESFADLIGVEVSSHFFIERDGSIKQFVSTQKRAWHAGISHYQGRDNCNDFSIGVELEGSDFVPFEQVQYQSLSKLLKDLMFFYNIEKSAIVGHCDVAPKRKTDPGPFFDWQYIFDMLDD